MREILLFCVVVSSVYCADETLSDLLELLKDPTILSKIEKRLGAGVEDDLFSDVIGCFDTSGTVNSNCDFYANSSAIIKTSESIARGAEFLKEYTNVTCPRECTARCCDLPNCDTSVYQDKSDHKCYLFHCGGKSSCVFTHHSDYWTGSISKETHKSHSFTPGVATHSHENELENLGSHDDDELEARTTRPTPPPTTVRPTTTTTTTTRATTITTSLPGLGDYCPSYGSKCEDPHAECLMKSCRCRVGYHEKHGVCRKHCRNEEFECENYAYYSDIDSRECIPSEYVCDGNPDCIDASDESNCQDKNKAYLDVDTGSNLYNSPYLNPQYNKQQDTQYPYGFPIPGLNSQLNSQLNNQPVGGLYPQTNPLYPGQIPPANQNTAGQYYVPGLTSQNQGNLPLANQGNPLKQQWPPLGTGVGSQVPVYQNNVPVQYPVQQQQSYLGQPGYIQNPVQPVQPVQPVNQNVQQPLQGLQPVQTNQAANIGGNQPPAVVNSQVTNPPVQPAPKVNQPAVQPVQPSADNDDRYVGNQQDKTAAQTQDATSKVIPLNRKEHVNTDLGDRYNEQSLDRQTPSSKTYNYNEGLLDSGETDVDISDLINHRHSAEEDSTDYDDMRTYPPATKTKTQIGSPTQSTVAGQKTSHQSEGFADYPWLSYDSDSPRVSGKKGNTASAGSKTIDPDRRKKPGVSNNENNLNNVNKPLVDDDDDNVPDLDSKPNSKPGSKSRINSQFDYKNRYNVDNTRFPDDYGSYDDYRRPVKQQRPYNQINNRYQGSRRRPSPDQGGSRYPYYPDSGYPRGRDRYPVWDPYKDEYYYPDDYEDRRDFDLHGNKDEKVPPRKPMVNTDDNRNNRLGPGQYPDRVAPGRVGPGRLGPPVNPTSTTVKQFVSTAVPTTAAPVPTQPPQTVKPTPVNIDKSDSQASVNIDQESKPVSQDLDSSSDNQSTDNTESKNSNTESKNSNTESKNSNTESKNSTDDEKTEGSGTNKFNILNAESVEVTSYTDSFQGPIVALALGLAITMMLLIFVGCRLRTVKRRLRKGRALHSNEADYLINGMYL